MLFIIVHCVYVCWIMDGGCLKSAPILTKTPKQTLNHIMVRWNVGLFLI
jgi:hypothetical protein